MGKRGRKSTVSVEEILTVVNENNFEILSHEEKIKPRKDEIWEKLSNALDKLIMPINLYFNFSQNRHNILDNYKKSIGLEVKNFSEQNNEANENDRIIEDELISDEEPVIKKTKKIIEFVIDIDSEMWDSMKPVDKKLKDGWQYILNDLIWKHTKLPCCFDYKRAHVCTETVPFITINGYCTECTAILTANCQFNDETRASFQIRTKNSYDIPHIKKKKLAGVELKKVMELLDTQSPKEVRRKLIDEKMNYGDIEPSNIYSLSALRKAKTKGQFQKLGIPANLNIWESLKMLKYSELSRFIKDIGYDKFYIFYWACEQIDVYNDIQTYLKNPVSLDSTGSLTVCIKKPDNSVSSEIFLTQIVTHVGNIIVPCAQILSEKNDANLLLYWLNEWKKCNAKTPQEVITDQSKALQNAVSLSFNLCTFSEYIDTCFESILKSEKVTKNLTCWLRIDINHLTHTIGSWDCFKSCNRRVKEFYRRCIGFISTVKSLNDISITLKQIFIVAQSKIDSEAVEEARANLIQIIKTYKIDENGDEMKPQDSEGINIRSDLLEELKVTYKGKKNENRPITLYVSNMKIKMDEKDDSSLNSSDFDKKSNDYYLPSLVDPLSNLCEEFPAWTNIMQNYFDCRSEVATSARSEGYFSGLKGSLLHNGRRQRVDKFLVAHCRQIDVDMTAARAEIQNSKLHKFSCVKNVRENNEHLTATENWRGKGDVEEIIDISSEQNSLSNILESNVDLVKSINLDHNYSKEDNEIALSSYNQLSEEINLNSLDCEIESNYNNFSEGIKINSSDNKIHEILHQHLVDNIIDIDTQEIIECNIHETEYTHKPNLLNRVNFHVDDTCTVQSINNNSQKIDDPQIQKVKKRGTFVSPDLDIDIHLQRPVIMYTKSSVIKNGNLLLSRKIFKNKYYIINTCAFDSCTEILKSAIRKSTEFNKFLEECSLMKGEFANDFQINLNYAEVILDVAKNRLRDLFYKKRAYILYHLFDHSESRIDCRVNVNQLFSTLMMPFPSSTEIIHCDQCKYENIIKKPVIFVNVNEIWSNGFKNLENLVNNFMKQTLVYCQGCKKQTAKKRIESGKYIFIDSDDAFAESSYTKEKNKCHFKINFQTIPQQIKIQNKNYLLSGIIEYVPAVHSDGLPHYVAYNRMLNNNNAISDWQKVDDMHKKAIILKKIPNLKLSSILYIEY